MNILVTGGAGFIGRWVVKLLLKKCHDIWVLDNLSNSTEKNLNEFKSDPHFKNFVKGDILDRFTVSKIFKNKIDICIHLAAQVDVQESLEDPKKALDVNVIGTFNLLEEARKHNTKFVLMGTCMVYDVASASKSIDENHPVKPLSPYAASKLSAELITESYHYGYGLPTVIIRPFNTYGPFQKSNLEGSVVGVFINRNLAGKELVVYGDGTQTRDFLYVEDCADFIVKAAFSERANGQTINAGLGKDISINELAFMITNDKNRIKHVPHHHPQAEIQKLLCNSSKAKEVLNWVPHTSLVEGIKRTEKSLKGDPI